MSTHRWFISVCCLITLALYPFESHAQSRPKIVIGYASMSSVATTLWVAQEKGFFAKNGLDVQTIFIPGSPTLIATINTGDVHMAYTGGTATLGAAVGGLDMKILAAFSNFGDQRVISQALETGTIQGASLAGVFSQRLKRIGYHFLADVEKLPLVGTSVVVKADYLAGHQAIARSALRALLEGHGYLLNPANKAAVMEIMTKKLGVTDPLAANDGYEDYVRRTDRHAFVVTDGLKNIQRFMKLRNPKIGDIKLDRLVDESILSDLEKSGFLEQALGGKSGVR